MKKLLFVAAIALICAASGVHAQVANFTYSGVPASVAAGGSFTFDITLNFTAGGALADVMGLDYWLFQRTPAAGPFNLAITNRNVMGSLFDLTGSITYPQIMDPINRNPNGTQIGTSLGASAVNPLPSGTYFIAHITLSIGAATAPGTYTIGNTVAGIPGVGGRISVIGASDGTTFQIAASNFSFLVTPVPEPSTFALLAVAAVGLGALAYRHRSASVS